MNKKWQVDGSYTYHDTYDKALKAARAKAISKEDAVGIWECIAFVEANAEPVTSVRTDFETT